MNKNQMTSFINNGRNHGNNDYSGFKIIKVNVSSSSESLYAVCAPVKIKE